MLAHLRKKCLPPYLSSLTWSLTVQWIYENAKAAFEAKGYQLPAVVFHNVSSWQMQTPVRAHTKGTALASGAGTNSFNYKFDGNITPMDHMLRVLNSPRYAEHVIHRRCFHQICS